MKKYSTIAFALLTFIVSCTASEDSGESGVDREKIERTENVSLDEIMESLSDKEGTYFMSSKQPEFRIKFPVSNVKKTSSTLLIDNEEVKLVHYTANMQGKDHLNLAYQLDYAFFPEVESDLEIATLFNNQREYILSATNSELEFEKVIELNEAPGRHLYLTVDKSNLKVNYKMYFKNGVFYTLEVITKEGNLFNPLIRDFFDSFELGNE